MREAIAITLLLAAATQAALAKTMPVPARPSAQTPAQAPTQSPGAAPAPTTAQPPAATATGAPAGEPLTTDALQKLRSVTQGAKAANLDAPVVKALGIGTGDAVISAKQFRAETGLGLFVFTIPVKPASDDIVLTFRDLAGVTYNYLSDSTRKLRKAMVTDQDGTRIVPNAEAESGFQDSLKAWAIIARRVKAP